MHYLGSLANETWLGMSQSERNVRELHSVVPREWSPVITTFQVAAAYLTIIQAIISAFAFCFVLVHVMLSDTLNQSGNASS